MNRLDSIRDLASDSIVVTGRVEDLGAYYERARIFVVPTRFAAGLPWKLFEAMSHGLPSVVTPLIAGEMALPEDEGGFLVGENAADFARKVVYLYNNEFLWHEFQKRALDYIRSHCDPKSLKNQLAEILEDLSPEARRRDAKNDDRFPVSGPPEPGSLMLRLDLTNKCSLGCVQCTLADRRRITGERAGDMDFGLFEKIVREVFPYASSVALSCEAEPTLHTRFLDILELIGENPGRVYKITTNANTLTEEAIDTMVRCGITEIYISVDGARDATYERIRRGGKFSRVAQAISHLNRLKERLGKGPHEPPLLQINYTLMQSTIAELPEMVELCREWNIHRLVLQHVYLTAETGLQAESLLGSRSLSDAILRRCRAQCEDYGIETLFPPLFADDLDACQPMEGGRPSVPSCLAPWRMVRVRWNGEVFPCDLWPLPGIGNLGTASFLDIWQSQVYERLRLDHARSLPTHPNCVGCTMVTTENVEGRRRRSAINYVKEAS
jgi:MoaA/NifB/PqqE/SkfB family radical SAM enzyme